MDRANLHEWIFSGLSELADMYRERFTAGDSKALAGVESCLEMGIKLAAVVEKGELERVMGGEQVTEEAALTEISLKDLSAQTLEELAEVIRNKEQQKP